MYKYTKRTISARKNYYEDARLSYYERLIFPAGYQNLQEIRQNPTILKLNSVVPIRFRDVEFGDSGTEIEKKIGRTRFLLQDNGFSPLAYFYKEELANHQLLVQLHFFGDRFVMATHSIIDADVRWRNIVKNTILEKYSGATCGQSAGSGDVSFSDKDGNRLFLMDSINLNIFYLSGNPEHLRLVDQFNQVKLNKANDDLENLKTLLRNSF